MTDTMMAALAALGGAMIGSLGGAFSSFLSYRQSRAAAAAENSRDIMRLGVEVGLKEWEFQRDLITKAGLGGKIPAPMIYTYMAGRFLLLGLEGKLNSATYVGLARERDAVFEAMREDTARMR